MKGCGEGYLPPKLKERDRLGADLRMEGLVDLRVLAVLGLAEEPPNPPLRTRFEGLRVWKDFCAVVGFFRGARTVFAFRPSMGDLAVVVMLLLEACASVDPLVREFTCDLYCLVGWRF